MTRFLVIGASKGIGRYKVFDDPDRWRDGLISRRGDADFIVHQFEDRTYFHRTPLVRY